MKISDYTLLEWLNILGYTEDDLIQSNKIQIAIEQWISSSNGKEPSPFFFDDNEKKEYLDKPLLERVYDLLSDVEKDKYDKFMFRMMLLKNNIK
jgi:hypothetical protein